MVCIPANVLVSTHPSKQAAPKNASMMHEGL